MVQKWWPQTKDAATDAWWPETNDKACGSDEQLETTDASAAWWQYHRHHAWSYAATDAGWPETNDTACGSDEQLATTDASAEWWQYHRHHAWSYDWSYDPPQKEWSDNNVGAAANDRHTGFWPHWHQHATAATETARIDLEEARERQQFADDVSFLEKHQDSDRRRRTAYRWNLKERRWQAAERIAMLQNDNNAWLDPMEPKQNKRKLSHQVLQCAKNLEVKDLSDSLPKTPTDWKDDDPQHSEPHLAAARSETYAETEVNKQPDKRCKYGMQEDQHLNLNAFIIQPYFSGQPTDPGQHGPIDLVMRKHALPRFANYSRVTPRLNKQRSLHEPYQVKPPYGVILLENYHREKNQNVSHTT